MAGLKAREIDVMLRAQGIARELANLGEYDYPAETQFYAGKLDEAAEACAEAIGRVILLSHIYFGTRLPSVTGGGE